MLIFAKHFVICTVCLNLSRVDLPILFCQTLWKKQILCGKYFHSLEEQHKDCGFCEKSSFLCPDQPASTIILSIIILNYNKRHKKTGLTCPKKAPTSELDVCTHIKSQKKTSHIPILSQLCCPLYYLSFNCIISCFGHLDIFTVFIRTHEQNEIFV